MGLGGQGQAVVILPLGKFWDPLYRRLGGPQGQSGSVQKISLPPGFHPRIVQPIQRVAVPTELSQPTKYAIVKPLYKYSNTHDVSNYRSVLVLTPFAKILKNVMQSRILRRLTKHNILSTEQCGFRTILNTDNATIKLTTEIQNAMNNKLIVRGIFCDLEKNI